MTPGDQPPTGSPSAGRPARPDGVDFPAAGRPRDPAVPTRTCVGCRQRAPKSDLLRVVAAEGACVPDLRGRLPGRGAYLHRRPGCLDLAERRRALPRALRVPGTLDTGALRRLLAPDEEGAGPGEDRAAPSAHVNGSDQE
ncbi:MAG: YlxR family protein [Candidatus Nanopelagicales bacterium]